MDGAATISVELPYALTRLFPGCERRIAVRALSVSEMIDALDRRWPGMRDRLCDERPAIRKHINVFVDGKRSRLNSALKPGVKVFIITAISGG